MAARSRDGVVSLGSHTRHVYTWRSQPVVNRAPHGNMLLSAAILFSGLRYTSVSDLAQSTLWRLRLPWNTLVDWGNFVRDVCSEDVRRHPIQLDGMDANGNAVIHIAILLLLFDYCSPSRSHSWLDGDLRWS